MPKAIKHFLFCAGLAFASPAALHAQGVPTVDTQSIAQQIKSSLFFRTIIFPV